MASFQSVSSGFKCCGSFELHSTSSSITIRFYLKLYHRHAVSVCVLRRSGHNDMLSVNDCNNHTSYVVVASYNPQIVILGMA